MYRESNSTAELTLMWMYVALYIEAEAPELYLNLARYYDISSKADRGDIFIIHDQKSTYRTSLVRCEWIDSAIRHLRKDALNLTKRFNKGCIDLVN